MTVTKSLNIACNGRVTPSCILISILDSRSDLFLKDIFFGLMSLISFPRLKYNKV